MDFPLSLHMAGEVFVVDVAMLSSRGLLIKFRSVRANRCFLRGCKHGCSLSLSLLLSIDTMLMLAPSLLLLSLWLHSPLQFVPSFVVFISILPLRVPARISRADVS